MDRRVECACGAWHWEQGQAWLIAKHGGVVVHAEPMVVHTGTPEKLTAASNASSRHGKHLNTEARKAYRKKWAKDDRARRRAAKVAA